MPLTQEHRLLAIKTELGDDVLAVRSIGVQEQISRLFQVEAELSSENGTVDFDKVVGGNVSIRLQVGQKGTRYFNGFISRFVQLANQGAYAHYHATIVPWLWFLTRTADCRIFQQKTVPDILEAVFKGHGFNDYQLKLSGSYEAREYCVQYRETDFNFVSRLMEQAGIHYFFEHESGKHTLVLADSASAHKPFPDYQEIIFHELDRGTVMREVVTDWTIEREVQPGACALNDFNFEKPKTSLLSNASMSRQHAASQFEMYDYPGEYGDHGAGDALAKVRIEELQSQFELLRGQSSARGLAAGHTFKLKNHPRKDQNREYLVTKTTLHVDAGEYASGDKAGEFFSCNFTVIDTQQNYRPLRLTPKPIVQGPQTAMVAGPKGEEIYTDKYGRVKVWFHWDRYSKADENSSCWIRVSQEWAGKKWGAIYLPRIGQEVIVEFLEGDPDRPLITGRVYNAETMPPYDLPAEQTKSTLKSNSSKGGNGFNEIRFEDKKGSEQIFIHAQHNMDVRVLNNLNETVYGNREIRVGWEKDGATGGDLDTLVKLDTNTHIKGGQYEQVEKDLNQTIQGAVVESYQKDQSTQVTGTRTVNAKEIVIETSDLISEKTAKFTLQAANDIGIKGGTFNVESTNGISLKCGGNFVTINSSGVAINGSMVNINSGGCAQPAAAVKPAQMPDIELPLDALVADDGKTGKKTGVGSSPRTRTKVTLTPIKAPPWKPPPPSASPQTCSPVNVVPVSSKPCAITALTVQCNHPPSGAKRAAVNNLLQIVPTDGATTLATSLTIQKYIQLSVEQKGLGNDTITAKMETNDGTDCKKQIAICTGGSPGDSDWKSGPTLSQTIPSPGNDGVWLDGVAPVIYHVFARGSPDDSPMVVQIEVYPTYAIQGTVNLNIFKDIANFVNEALKSTIKRGLGVIDIEPQILLPAGQLQVSCGWKEHTDWRAFYGWEIVAGLEPLFGFTLQIRPNLLALAGTAVGIPPALTDYAASIFVHFAISGQVGLNGRMARVGPDSIAGGVQPDGQIWVELGLGARVGDEKLVSAEIVGLGRTGVTLKGNIEYRSGPGGGLVFAPSLGWDGLKITVRLVTSMGGEEMTNSDLVTWNAFDPGTIWEPDSPYVIIGNG